MTPFFTLRFIPFFFLLRVDVCIRYECDFRVLHLFLFLILTGEGDILAGHPVCCQHGSAGDFVIQIQVILETCHHGVAPRHLTIAAEETTMSTDVPFKADFGLPFLTSSRVKVPQPGAAGLPCSLPSRCPSRAGPAPCGLQLQHKSCTKWATEGSVTAAGAT